MKKDTTEAKCGVHDKIESFLTDRNRSRFEPDKIVTVPIPNPFIPSIGSVYGLNLLQKHTTVFINFEYQDDDTGGRLHG